MSLANILVSLRALPFAQVTTEVGIADPRCGPVFGDTTRLQMAPRSFHQGPRLERTGVEHDLPVVSPICEHRSPAFGQRHTFAHHPVQHYLPPYCLLLYQGTRVPLPSAGNRSPLRRPLTTPLISAG